MLSQEPTTRVAAQLMALLPRWGSNAGAVRHTATADDMCEAEIQRCIASSAAMDWSVTIGAAVALRESEHLTESEWGGLLEALRARNVHDWGEVGGLRLTVPQG